jgi:hypothetical protein
LHRSPFLTVLLIFVTLLLASGIVRAELPPQLTASPETLADGFLKDLARRVSLTPQERAAVRPILIEQSKKRQDVARARLAASPGMAGMLALRQDLSEITRETDARLAAVLPPEKMAAVRACRDERRQQARSRQLQAQKGE